jgi:hypothetical protein
MIINTLYDPYLVRIYPFIHVYLFSETRVKSLKPREAFMSEGLILIFVLYIIYLIMKKPKTTTEKTVPKAKTEQPTTTVATRATPKKPSPDQKPAKKTQAVALQPDAAAPEIAMPERVGLTAGNIWHYLTENGATPVAKLVRELPEEEKIIQRSIGWLAQEGKITLDTVDRVETIALKG